MNRNQARFSPGLRESHESADLLDGAVVCQWFSAPVAVEHYTRAAASLGLWRAEEVVFSQVFAREQRLLDIGCGAGRIAFGLWRLGFRQVVGIDFCAPMIAEARELRRFMDCGVAFEVGDATRLAHGDAAFDGAIFGFNGLMQIPGRANRLRALRELRRVLRPGGRLVFTTHDRGLLAEREWWAAEAQRWERGEQDPRLIDPGDRILERAEGRIFMHVTDRAEVLLDLADSGWTHEFDQLRFRIANEPAPVRDFSDECRFWVARA